jgi:hypothetical protein
MDETKQLEDLYRDEHSIDSAQVNPDSVGNLRNHPEDATEQGQCFDADRYGSPYFVLKVRASTTPGQPRQASLSQGINAGNPGYRVLLPMQELTQGC